MLCGISLYLQLRLAFLEGHLALVLLVFPGKFLLAALLIGGNLTTTDLISMAVRLLLTTPDQLAAFKADPGLASAVVEETLRYDPPIDITGRVVMEDRELAGCPVKARQHVMTSLRAANRDPAVFPNPDVFDPARPHTAPHVAFGGGSHFCIGAPLARLELELLFGALAEALPEITLLPGAVRRPGFQFRGYVNLPIVAPSASR
jgi:cytochrome P450